MLCNYIIVNLKLKILYKLKNYVLIDVIKIFKW